MEKIARAYSGYMKYLFVFILLLLSSILSLVSAQAKNDYIWVLGYPPNKPEKHFGGVMFNFKNNIALPEYFNTISGGTEPAILSSPTGRLLAYTDGCSLYDSRHEIMANGDSLSFGEIWTSYCDHGYPTNQSNLILPWPNDTTKAIIFHVKVADDITTYYLLYSIIEFNTAHPNGVVTKKNEFLLEPGTTGLITATRHGNGRDWWILMPEEGSNRYFLMLLSPEGVSIVDTQSIGTAWEQREWASQSVFTPDGTKYIRANPWKGVDIFDFDRCSGLLSNAIESGSLTDPIQIGSGAAVSVDSRYLYISSNIYLYQFDLTSESIFDSKILIGTYDGYLNPFATTFYQMSLAPDGKIYIFSTNGVKSLHVINDPELRGDSCNFIQHGIELPAYIEIGSVNIPFFRLGPDIGSKCDSLNINKSPIANFRFEVDSNIPFRVHFKNLSYFEPTDFLWDFGNNTYSQDEHPSFVDFNQQGIFNVCLTASNSYGQHTFCVNVDLQYTSTFEMDLFGNGIVKIFPNPVLNEINFQMYKENLNLKLNIISNLGIQLFQATLNEKQNVIDVSHLQPGMYYYNLSSGNIVQAGKFFKI